MTGQRFADFKPRPRITWADGVDLVRSASRAHGTGDVYWSRGPVLWAMHVLKLQAWYLHCYPDGALWDPIKRRPLELKLARSKRVKKKPARTYRADPRWGF